MAIGDQYFDKVVLALPFDTDLKDYSSRKNIVSAYGNVAPSATKSKFGGKSAYFDGSGDRLAINMSSDLDMGSGAFTIDFWYYPVSAVASDRVLQTRDGDVSSGIYLSHGSATTLQFYVSTTGSSFVGSGITITIAQNQWQHIAIVRNDNTVRAYLNGTDVGTAYGVTGAIYYSATDVMIIGGQSSGRTINGYLDDLRITKAARYTSNFSVPTVANPLYMAQVQGTVKDANGNFARRLVRAHRRSDGVVVDEKLSDQSTGAFTLNTPDTTKHYAVVHDSDAWITYLPFNGDNNSTLFPEWGGKVVTPYGNAKISTAQSKFGGASALFDGSGGYLTLPSSRDVNMGSGDFTVECWVRLSSVGVVHQIWDNRSTVGAGGDGMALQITSGNVLRFIAGDSNTSALEVDFPGGTTLAVNTWYHVAIVRSGTTFTLYLNGVSVGTSTSSVDICDGSGVFIGASLLGTNYFNGHIDDLRISKGKAQYVGNFTPPTAPHFTEQAGDPYWNNVVLAMHMDGQPDNGDTHRNSVVLNMRGNALTDDTGKVVTAYGGAAVVDVAGRSAFGGKAYSFDGAGDYLGIPSTGFFGLGTADFTLELFAYLTGGQGTDRNLLDFRTSTANEMGSFFIDGTTNKLAFWTGAVKLGASGTVLSLSTWYHVALVRVSGVTSCYLNGVLDWTSGTAMDFGTSRQLSIGASMATGIVGNGAFSGYLDDIRITKGVGRYTAPFTPPAAELPQLSRSFPEAKSGQLVTAYGDAKISATQSKFGGYSAYFDGTGDYLTVPDVISLLYSGDFTVEAFVRLNSVGVTQVLVASRSSVVIQGLVLYFDPAVGFSFVMGDSNSVAWEVLLTSGLSGLVINTWYHVAVTRAGSTFTLWVDGVSKATAAWGGSAGGFGSATYIGAEVSGSTSLNGYIDDLRITKGIARYTGNFTPPVEPFSEVLGTWGQQNAMVFDHLTPV